jgi:hypothetical protein
MRQRNYVAKYSQRSGAGKHKRKDKQMGYINKEDWMHIDDYNAEHDKLTEKVSELQQVIDDLKYDEAYILSLIIGLRENARSRQEWETLGRLDHIIFLHSAAAQAQAHKLRSK